jgi:hypothetical protein
LELRRHELVLQAEEVIGAAAQEVLISYLEHDFKRTAVLVTDDHLHDLLRTGRNASAIMVRMCGG